MKKIIYLAGNISSDPRTYEWRELAVKLLSEKYEVLNPAANSFNKKLLKYNKPDEVDKFVRDAVRKSQRILIVKDFNLVNKSDIILVDLTLVTPGKPPLGTIFELAWSWMLRKPVIAILPKNTEDLKGLEKLYATHPFITSSISGIAHSVEEAIELILEFFEE